jgi:hypothetical protein
MVNIVKWLNLRLQDGLNLLFDILWAYTVGGADVYVDRKVPKEKRTSRHTNDWWR